MGAQLNDIGLLILRVGAGGLMLICHGWTKFMHYFDTQYNLASFPDPIGLGGAMSHHLATFAEFGCSILVILGVLTRISSLPLTFTMAVAAFVVKSGDPISERELPLLFFALFLSLICTGGGKYASL